MMQKPIVIGLKEDCLPKPNGRKPHAEQMHAHIHGAKDLTITRQITVMTKEIQQRLGVMKAARVTMACTIWLATWWNG